MPWISEANDLIQLLRIEDVMAVELDVGDILLLEAPLHITEIHHTDDGRTRITCEGGGLIDTESSTRMTRLLRLCLRDPPVSTSWATFAAKVEAAVALKIRTEAVRDDHRCQRPFEWSLILRKMQASVQGFCDGCCLPLGPKHAPHEPPNMARPSGGPSAWAPYMKARYQLYSTALRALSREEILGMPLPTNRMYLQAMIDELITRDRHQVPPRTRYQRIRGD